MMVLFKTFLHFWLALIPKLILHNQPVQCWLNLEDACNIQPLTSHKIRQWRGSIAVSEKLHGNMKARIHLNFRLKTRTLLQRPSVWLAWRLDREMRRRLILHETGFPRLRFFTSYFIDVEYSSGYLLFICFWIDLVQALATTGNKGLDSSEITSLPEIKKVICTARHFTHHRK